MKFQPRRGGIFGRWRSYGALELLWCVAAKDASPTSLKKIRVQSVFHPWLNFIVNNAQAFFISFRRNQAILFRRWGKLRLIRG